MTIEIKYKMVHEERLANTYNYIRNVYGGDTPKEDFIRIIGKYLQWHSEMAFKEGFDAGKKFQECGIDVECVADRDSYKHV